MIVSAEYGSASCVICGETHNAADRCCIMDTQECSASVYDRVTRTCSYALTEYICSCSVAGIGYLAGRRPRFAKISAAVGTLVAGPYLLFSAPVLSRYQTFAANVVAAAEKLQSEGSASFGDSGWGDSSQP